ncbi:MAG: DNA primase [Candidatus Colwellbacteria bacterium RIFCSPHIGHO2_12_FULL_44_17]|uniref:DNA primase n=2 Tax=Candidatus Colwelliibacteriota TaxID=1817904 RepID=A0A1G1Z788_9BACT|nr:MAG: DNA primase [Candidatus Colwellbacteria bacterium RIFCSPHIGHO2_12_FULL_44_17]OGY60501.1 MAG: DNA primase [Candidatus Colwellbacteria bacterium RIFCSPLOWO2_02_FULL_44_20b]
MTSSSPVEDIKAKLDLVEFLKGYLEMRPAGKNLKALCPFHGEKTPSFIISPERQIWHCFGCGEGGDIFKFIMRYENIEFYEALKILAEKAGVELRHISPADQREFGILYDINETAKNFFREKLSISPEAQQYLTSRGLTQETIREFELGFASPGFDELAMYLMKAGYDVSNMIRAGLTFKTEKGKHMDRFRGRIMFPLYNHFGKVIGFTGRVLPQYDTGEMGKYVNSPETPIFNKSRVLYGFHKSKNHIRDANLALLVEGQMDFLMTYQDGVKNVIATSGTALTPEHLKTLRRLADTLILSFDTDEAGLAAAERSIDLAGAHDFNVKVLNLGKFKDPAEAVQKKPGVMEEFMRGAILAMEHYFQRYVHGATLQDQKHGIRIILSKIKNLFSKIEQAHWLKKLSQETGVHERYLVEEMDKVKSDLQRDSFDGVRTAPEERKFTRRELIAERLLTLAYSQQQFLSDIGPVSEFLPGSYRDAYVFLSSGNTSREPQGDSKELIGKITLLSALISDEQGEELILLEFRELLRILQLVALEEQREALRLLIKQLERNENPTELELKLREFDSLSRKMQDIKNASKTSFERS